MRRFHPGWFAVTCILVFLGGCMPLHDQPDWLVGKDPIEGASRSVGGVIGGHTGRVLYANGFEDGLGGIFVDLLDATYVFPLMQYSNNGSICLKMRGAAGDTEGRNFSRNHRPISIDRIGLELSVRSFYTAGEHYQTLIFGYYLYDYDVLGKTVGAIVKIVQSAALDGAVYIWNSSAAWEDTGIRLTKFFLEAGETYSNVGYHSLKLTADFREAERKYIAFIVDGVAHDLSAHACVVADTSEPANALYLYSSYSNQSPNENYITVDDIVLTDQEP